MKLIFNELSGLLIKTLPKICRVLLAIIILIWSTPGNLIIAESFGDEDYIKITFPNFEGIAQAFSKVSPDTEYTISVGNIDLEFNLKHITADIYSDIYIDKKIYFNQVLLDSVRKYMYFLGWVNADYYTADDPITLTEEITPFDTSRPNKTYSCNFTERWDDIKRRIGGEYDLDLPDTNFYAYKIAKLIPYHFKYLDEYTIFPESHTEYDGIYKFIVSADFAEQGIGIKTAEMTLVKDTAGPTVEITEINGQPVTEISDNVYNIEVNNKYIDSIKGKIKDNGLDETYDLDPAKNIVDVLTNEKHFVLAKKLHEDSSDWDYQIMPSGNYTVTLSEMPEGESSDPDTDRPERAIYFKLERSSDYPSHPMELKLYETNYFSITAIDKALNMSSIQEMQIMVDTTPPDFSIIVPEDASVQDPSAIESAGGMDIVVDIHSIDITDVEIRVRYPDKSEYVHIIKNSDDTPLLPVDYSVKEPYRRLGENYGPYVISATATDVVGIKTEKRIAIYYGIQPGVVAIALGPNEVIDHTIDDTKDKIKVEGFDGSLSFDPDNSTTPRDGLVFNWTISPSTDTEIEGTTTAFPTIYLPHTDELATYTIQLEVTDDDGETNTDNKQLEVKNSAPSVEICNTDGAELHTIDVELNQPVTLKGIGVDVNNDTLTYNWDISPTAGRNITRNEGAEVDIVFTEIRDDYMVTLTVTDEHGLSASDFISINVVDPNNILKIIYPNPNEINFDSVFAEKIRQLFTSLLNILPGNLPPISFNDIFIDDKLYVNNIIINNIKEYLYILGKIGESIPKPINVIVKSIDFSGDEQDNYPYECKIDYSGIIPWVLNAFIRNTDIENAILDKAPNFYVIASGEDLTDVFPLPFYFGDYLVGASDSEITLTPQDNNGNAYPPVVFVKDTEYPVVRIDKISDGVSVHDVNSAVIYDGNLYIDIETGYIDWISGWIEDYTVDTSDIHKDDYHFILTKVVFDSSENEIVDFITSSNRSIELMEGIPIDSNGDGVPDSGNSDTDIDGDGVPEVGFIVMSEDTTGHPLIQLDDPLDWHKIKITALDKALNPSTLSDNPDSRSTVFVKHNLPPIAVAGVDPSSDITDHRDSSHVTLKGDGSSDPNGDTLTYNWELIRAVDPNNSPIDLNGVEFPFIEPRIGPNWKFEVHNALDTLDVANIQDGGFVTLVFRLTVTETISFDPLESSIDIIVKIFNNSPVVEITGAPTDPIVIAGSHVMVPLSSLVNDSNYDETFIYSWSIANPSSGVEFEDDTNNDNCIVKITEEGNYQIKLEVTDEHNATGSNVVVIEAISGNRPPTANAGPDQSEITDHKTLVTLDGSGSSDPDLDDTLTYSWKLSNANVDTDGDGTYDDTNVPLDFTFPGTAQNPSFDVHDVLDNLTLLNNGSIQLEFTLTVTDSHGARDTDNVLVRIINNAPVIEPLSHDPETVYRNTPVTLNATITDANLGDNPDDQTPADNSLFTYSWTIVEQPNDSTATITDDDGDSVYIFTADTIGNYEISLTVNDIHGAMSEIQNLTITVGNQVPVAVASVNPQEIDDHIGQSINLNGSGSSDPDSDPITHEWKLTMVNDTSVDLIVSSEADKVFTNAHEIFQLAADNIPDILDGDTVTLTFELIVTDTFAATSQPAEVNVVIQNNKPTAVIGIWDDANNDGIVDSGEISTPDDDFYVGGTISLGSIVTDNNNDTEFTYNWSSEPNEGITIVPNGDNCSVTLSSVGIYNIKLIVVDEHGASSDEASLTIAVNEPENQPPVVADAKVVYDGVTYDNDSDSNDTNPVSATITNHTAGITLDGSGSTGDNLSYLWTLVSVDGTSFNIQIGNSTILSYNDLHAMLGVNIEILNNITCIVSLTVTDRNNNTATDEETITIVNNAPVISLTAPETADINTEVTVTCVAVDPNGDTELTYTWTITDPFGNITNPAAESTYSFTPSQVGIYSISVQVRDSHNATSTPASVPIQVSKPTSGNNPPVARDDSAETAEDTGVTINVLGNDEDQDEEDTLIITSVTSPANGTAVIVDGMINYVPNENFNGTDTFNYTITDGRDGEDTATVTVTVNPVNDAPVLSPIGNRSVNEGDLLNFTVTATDVDGDTLTYSTVGLPGGASFDSSTGEFNWVPGPDQEDDYNVTFTVSDGVEEDSETITITVGDGNQPPVAIITTDSLTTGVAPLTITFNGTNSHDPDPDDSIVSYEWDFGDGNIANGDTVTHTFSTDGEYTVTLTVTDTQGGTGTAQVTIDVAPAGTTLLAIPKIVVEGVSYYSTNNTEPAYTVINHTAPFRTIKLDASESITDRNGATQYTWTCTAEYVDGSGMVKATDPADGREVSYTIEHKVKMVRYTFTLGIQQERNTDSRDIVVEVENSPPNAEIVRVEDIYGNVIDHTQPIPIPQNGKDLWIVGKISDDNSEPGYPNGGDSDLLYKWSATSNYIPYIPYIPCNFLIDYHAFIVFDYRIENDKNYFKGVGIKNDNTWSLSRFWELPEDRRKSVNHLTTNIDINKYYKIEIELKKESVTMYLLDEGNQRIGSPVISYTVTADFYSNNGGTIGFFGENSKSTFKNMKIEEDNGNGTRTLLFDLNDNPNGEVKFGSWSYDTPTRELTGQTLSETSGTNPNDFALVIFPEAIKAEKFKEYLDENKTIIISAELKTMEFPERFKEVGYRMSILETTQDKPYDINFYVKDKHDAESQTSLRITALGRSHPRAVVSPGYSVTDHTLNGDGMIEVTLDGRESWDPDGLPEELSFHWEQINMREGEEALRIEAVDTATPTVYLPHNKDITNDVYYFRLTVTDEDGYTGATGPAQECNDPMVQVINTQPIGEIAIQKEDGRDYPRSGSEYVVPVTTEGRIVPLVGILSDSNNDREISYKLSVDGIVVSEGTITDAPGEVIYNDLSVEPNGEYNVLLESWDIHGDKDTFNLTIVAGPTAGIGVSPAGIIDNHEQIITIDDTTSFSAVTREWHISNLCIDDSKVETDGLKSTMEAALIGEDLATSQFDFKAHDALNVLDTAKIIIPNGTIVSLEFKLTVYDANERSDIAYATVKIRNLAPNILDVITDVFDYEGQRTALVVCAVHDPNNIDSSEHEELEFRWEVNTIIENDVVPVPFSDVPIPDYIDLPEGRDIAKAVRFTAESNGLYYITIVVTDRHGAVSILNIGFPVDSSSGTPVTGNRPPVAAIGAHCIEGNAPLTIILNGSEHSYDPDGDAIVEYKWFMQEGNTTVRTELGVGEDLTWTFTTAGTRLITLEVKDEHGAIGRAQVAIHVHDGTGSNTGNPDDDGDDGDDDGDNGDDGNNGLDGTNGTDGNNGRDGTGGNNESGEYNESGTTSSRSAKNTAGSDGEDGRDGAAGANGFGGAGPIIVVKNDDDEPTSQLLADKPDDGLYGTINIIRTYLGWELWKGREFIGETKSSEDKSYKLSFERELETLRDGIKRITDSLSLERGGEISQEKKEDNVGYAMLDNSTKKEINNINEFYPKEKETITRLAMNTSTTENSKDSPAPEQEGNDKSEKSSFPFKDFVKKIVLALIMLFIYPFMHKKFL